MALAEAALESGERKRTDAPSPPGAMDSDLPCPRSRAGWTGSSTTLDTCLASLNKTSPAPLQAHVHQTTAPSAVTHLQTQEGRRPSFHEYRTQQSLITSSIHHNSCLTWPPGCMNLPTPEIMSCSVIYKERALPGPPKQIMKSKTSHSEKFLSKAGDIIMKAEEGGKR